MEPEIHPISEADNFAAFVKMLETAAGRHPTREALTDAVEAYPLDRTFGAFDERGRLVGGTGSDLLQLTVPGSVMVPAARATLTGVLPTHRGRGLASRLLGRQLHDCLSRGEFFMVATTSTPGLLRRVGYGAASVAVQIEVELPRLRFGDKAAGAMRLLDPSEYEVVLPGIYERHRRQRMGQVSRSEPFWRTWMLDREFLRTAPGQRFAVVWEDKNGLVDGYLTYRLIYGDLRQEPIRALVIEDLVDATHEARRELWRYALSFKQASVLIADNVSQDEPLRWLLDDLRRLRITGMRDLLWVRLVDVAMALSARRYCGSGSIILGVTDDVVPLNTGSYELNNETGSARCKRTDTSAEITLDVADLAAAYFGKTTFASLAAAGCVTEWIPGAINRADELFRCSRPAWTVSDW